ncbi:interferon gamma 1 precursor [Boleophthalmus pectinirostris]|uniref:interferon gamma 1 precursor n=1 Tax=Boleophthalmus pectinirostris TaxID=150288 RepID=UPI000CDE4A8C|nr:interferon gamma 1 precursor [Boleophthalmus pectinirostris]
MDATGRVALCVCVLLFVAQVRSSHIPRTMNQTLQRLRRHYKIPNTERYNGTPVFSRDPFKAKEVKKVFMGGILETYDTLLHRMMEQLPTSGPSVDSPANANANTDSNGTVRNDLSYILGKVQALKNLHYKEQKDLLDRLQTLHNITTDNLMVQSKALGELPWFYEEASSLVNNEKKRRRRRHTQRATKRAKVRKE